MSDVTPSSMCTALIMYKSCRPCEDAIQEFACLCTCVSKQVKDEDFLGISFRAAFTFRQRVQGCHS